MEVVQAHPDIMEVVQDTLAEAVDTMVVLVHAIDTMVVLVPLPAEACQNTKAVAHPKGSQNQI